MQVPSQSPPAIPASIPDLIYDLRPHTPDSAFPNSNAYFADVARFSQKLLAEAELRAMPQLNAYSDYVQITLREPPRSLGEYSIELLTLGLLLARYARAAETTPVWAVSLARELYWLRRRSPGFKSASDFLRARLTRAFLMPQITRDPLPCPNFASCQRTRPCRNSKRGLRYCARFKNGSALSAEEMKTRASQAQMLNVLPRLIEWLIATGEFEQEAMRLNNWRSYIHSLPDPQAIQCIEIAVSFYHWFRREADAALGVYTRDVPTFLATEYRRRPIREDQLLCGKDPVEYHLGMVAAEIMNRGLRDDFVSKAHKVVLIPACMRGPYATFCRARASGSDIRCAACSPGCSVNRLTRRMRDLGVTVYVVPHATGFNRWLDRWQRQPDTGVAAVACLLNILPGGYEMRARNIASQCVPLDFPGCQKHWRHDEVATSLNEDQLVQILQAPGNRQEVPAES